jgi:hypothetical protein
MITCSSLHHSLLIVGSQCGESLRWLPACHPVLSTARRHDKSGERSFLLLLIVERIEKQSEVSRFRRARSHGQFRFGLVWSRIHEQLLNDLHGRLPLRRRMKLQIHISLGLAVMLRPSWNLLVPQG